MASGQATNVPRITSGDERTVELESRCYNEGVDSVGGGHACLGQEKSRTLGDWLRKVHNQDTAVVEQTVDGSVEARPSADLTEDWRGHANEGAAIMRK